MIGCHWVGDRRAWGEVGKTNANNIDENNTKCDEFNDIHLPT